MRAGERAWFASYIIAQILKGGHYSFCVLLGVICLDSHEQRVQVYQPALSIPKNAPGNRNAVIGEIGRGAETSTGRRNI